MARSRVSRDDVFRFVRDRLLAGEPPTVREVQKAMGYAAVESARKQLEALVAEGRLMKLPGRARGYGLPVGADGDERVVRVPLVHGVPTGPLEAALERCQSWIVVQSVHPAEQLFAIRVDGTGGDVGFQPEDVVVVRRTSDAIGQGVVLCGTDAARAFSPATSAVAPIVGQVLEIRRRVVQDGFGGALADQTS